MNTFSKKDGRPVISYEFFPPKTDAGEKNFWEALRALNRRHTPDAVSVTYGAGGSSRDRTESLVCQVKSEMGLTAVAHLTCIGDTKQNLVRMLDHYKEQGIREILALRGDRQPHMPDDAWETGDFKYANELVAFIRERYPEFTVGVAAYPEGHPEAPDYQSDLVNFKRKVDAGADFAATQFFYNNDAFFTFLDDAHKMGVEIPIIPGILPITDFKQVQRFAALCGAKLPEWLVSKLEAVKEDKEAMHAVGVEVAIEQCRDLLERGCHGLHFFTLNKARAVDEILSALTLESAP
ncbi:MAG: methylenetetrahydrofolate reductase [NAD(P)H] [Magnetococcales bacterium]|nr:methylenetetrahydrofolate reductase [NAD(P)H] [Magnetococcales bacterium]